MIRLNKSAFTLIELLVVIAIIGILSTLAIVALGNARTKARDTKRLADIKQVSTALELYYADNSSYPIIITPGNSLKSPDGNTTYMGVIPSNPTPRNDGNCANLDYSYTYTTATNTYNLSTCLGSTSSTTNAGIIAASPEGIFNCGQTITDRDGYTYATVQIGSQCWMKQNLKTKTRPSGVALTNLTNGSERDCISNTCVSGTVPYCAGSGYIYQRGVESDCQNGYALYTWSAAMDLPSTCDSTSCSSSIHTPHQGICPNGWHVPADEDWYTLEDFLKNSSAIACTSSRYGWSTGFECASAGLKMASDDPTQSLVGCSGNALCNTSGFSAYFAGTRSSDGQTFTSRGTSGTFIEASERNSSTIYVRSLYAQSLTGNYDKILRTSQGKAYSMTLRCVAN